MLKIQEINEIIKSIDCSSISEFTFQTNGTTIAMKKNSDTADIEQQYQTAAHEQTSVKEGQEESVPGVSVKTEKVENIADYKIANNEEISFKQENIQFEGWAIECRINAEHPFKNFMPSAGGIEMYLAPGGLGVRVDSAAYPGYRIPPYYDSMIAKLITYGSSREEAIRRMRRALDEFLIDGIHHTIPFHRLIMEHEVFIAGDYNTNFLEKHPILEKETVDR